LNLVNQGVRRLTGMKKRRRDSGTARPQDRKTCTTCKTCRTCTTCTTCMTPWLRKITFLDYIFQWQNSFGLYTPGYALISIPIFFIKFRLREVDPSFLQTSASSDLSEFGMTGYFWGHWRKKRRFATTFFFSMIAMANRRFFLLLINFIPVIPSPDLSGRGISFSLSAIDLN
jgi:hypothetical protein